MIQLHADDALGEAAGVAAQFAHLLDFHLLAAASANMNRAQRAKSAERALRQFYSLARAITKLEEAAPNAAERARQADLKVRDWIEAANAERSEVTATGGEVSPGSTP